MYRLGSFLVIICALAAAIGIAVAVDHSEPVSSPGTVITGSDTARVPPGGSIAFSHQSGKVTYYWVIADVNGTVHLDSDGWFASHDRARLCGTGCTVDEDMGWGDHFYFTLLPSGALRVQWPWGWDYRAPRS